MNETISYNQAIFGMLIEHGGYDAGNVAAALTRAQNVFRKYGIQDFDRQYDWKEVDSNIIIALETNQWKELCCHLMILQSRSGRPTAMGLSL